MATLARTGRTAGPPGWVNRLVLAVLRSPAHGLLSRSVCELRYSPRSGRTVALPVGYTRDGARLVVIVAEPDRKRWWRAFCRPRPVSARVRGRLRPGTGRLLTPGQFGYADALLAYRMRTAHAAPPGALVLLVE